MKKKKKHNGMFRRIVLCLFLFFKIHTCITFLLDALLQESEVFQHILTTYIVKKTLSRKKK